MPRIIRRTKVISIRLSNEEYDQFRNLCVARGTDSISELARTALRLLASDEKTNGKAAVECRVETMDTRVSDWIVKSGASLRYWVYLDWKETMVNIDVRRARFVVLLCMSWIPAVSQTSPRLVATLPDSIANLPVQKIGIDDLIGISVYDSPELTRTVRVASDGAIRLPMVKARIPVVGLLPAEIETVIGAQLTKEQILVDPIVTISVVESRSRPIVVSGAVKNAITFQASSQTSLLDALARADGLSPDAGPEILVSKVRTGSDGVAATLTQRISIKALIDMADPEANLQLQGGEQIRVPEAGRVYVVGNVRKPGAFVIRDASETSVLRVLALSEGLEKFSAKEAYIYRREQGPAGKNEIPIEIEKIMQRKAPDVPLQANDVLYIPDNQGKRSFARILESIATIGGGAAVASIYLAK